MSKLAKILLTSPESRRAWSLVPQEAQDDYLRRIECNFSRSDLRNQDLRKAARDAFRELYDEDFEPQDESDEVAA